MKPYRLKHKPSGLYYQPTTKGSNNLGKNGKVYLTGVNGLSAMPDPICIVVKGNSIAYKMTKDALPWKDCTWRYRDKMCNIPHSDFEKEYITDIE